MSTPTVAPSAPPVSRGTSAPSLGRRVSSFLYAHPRARLALLLTAPLFWLAVVYVVALSLLLVTAFWSTDSFTGDIDTTFTLDTILGVVTDAFYQGVTLRTVLIALAVTVIDVTIAVPVAFYIAKVASTRARRILVILVLMPLWASYLVKVYAWRSVLAENGLLSWLLAPVGGGTPGYGLAATIIALSYLWLPFVIIPIQAGMERVPDSLLEASSDLGAKSWRTTVSVVLPLAVPSIIAGTIFSFALTLGDYITVKIVGGTSQMLGNLVYDNVGSANNLPLAAAIALIPIAIIFTYLFIVRRTGALDSL